MSLAEKMGYLRGLADSLHLDEAASPTEKLLAALVDTVEELAEQAATNEEAIRALGAHLEELSEDLDVLETLVVDTFEEDDEAEEYELECPNCGGTLILDGATLESGIVTCPACRQKFEIDLGFEGP